jgi:putative membrane protein insertion efficiency factor
LAQVNAKKYRNIIPEGSKKIEYWQAKDNKNEVQAAFSGLFLFYKSFISSQDLTVCTFTPSCSEYGILAVKGHGIIKGGLMTMDRLTRCNGLSPEKYEVDKSQMLLKDDPNDAHLVPIVSNIK